MQIYPFLTNNEIELSKTHIGIGMIKHTFLVHLRGQMNQMHNWRGKNLCGYGESHSVDKIANIVH